MIFTEGWKLVYTYKWQQHGNQSEEVCAVRVTKGGGRGGIKGRDKVHTFQQQTKQTKIHQTQNTAHNKKKKKKRKKKRANPKNIKPPKRKTNKPTPKKRTKTTTKLQNIKKKTKKKKRRRKNHTPPTTQKQPGGDCNGSPRVGFS